MSKVLRTHLEKVYARLGDLQTNVADAKVGIAEALRYNGITNVGDTETFARYVELIRRLKSTNSMILEFTIPTTSTLTAYKRTVVLPMYFGVAGNSGYSLNSIATEIIDAEAAASTTSTTSVLSDEAEILTASVLSESSISTMSLSFGDGSEELVTTSTVSAADTTSTEEETTTTTSELGEHEIYDMYGNIITDGNYVDTISMDDITEYLTEEEQEEFLTAAENLGYTVSDEGISILSLAADDGISVASAADPSTFEPDTTATYSYIVDWGDGTEAAFDHNLTYTDNKAAIWHTYETGGTYDVTITGSYKRIYTQGADQSYYVVSGEYVRDNDGVALMDNYNYGMIKYLVAVIAWGNTLLTNMESAFALCASLADIPMYDTTNSFADVTTLSSAFRGCTSLTSLPFNTNTNKGLFSDCTKVTSFYRTFYQCTGLTDAIPDKLCDGCTSVTSVSEMFNGCSNMTGSIPLGLFSGMTALTNASSAFSGNSNMDGEISSDLFADCPNITSIAGLFKGCTKITGTLEYGFIGKLSKLTDMRQAFYNCQGLNGFTADAFQDLTADGINCRMAFFQCLGITEIPEGLLESFTGKNHLMERMFDACTNLTTIPSTALEGLHVSSARGMFSGCSKLTSALPTANDDWSRYEGIRRWYGAFSGTALSDIDSVCFELGGNAARKFSKGKVGAIVLANYTTVDRDDYVYDSNNVPIGIVYADEYINETVSTATIANGAGNVVTSDTEGATHKLFATVFNDTTRAWTNGSNNYQDVTTITNTSNLNVGYNRDIWSVDSEGNYSTSLATIRYNGEAYTKAINEWRVSQGMATYDESSGYTATSTDTYNAVNYVNTYSQNGITSQTCFLPDGADLWDQFTMKYLIQSVIDKVIAGGGGYSSSNCNSMRNSTWYWASAEGNASGAWICYTYNATLNGWHFKWISSYVRPSFALTVVDAATSTE